MTANKCDLGGSESQITKRCTNDADRNFLGLELVAPRSSKIKTGPLESKLFRKLRNKLTPTTTPMYRYYDTSTYSIHSAGILLFRPGIRQSKSCCIAAFSCCRLIIYYYQIDPVCFSPNKWNWILFTPRCRIPVFSLSTGRCL
jgi:hypothetical protein